MAAVYGIFFVEIAAYRFGKAKLEKMGIDYSTHMDDHTDAHAHNHQNRNPLGVETTGQDDPNHVHPSNSQIAGEESPSKFSKVEKDIELGSETASLSSQVSTAEAAAQLLGVAILEFGIIFHSVIIGLTLAVNDEFTTLFIVLIFHQMFEGLGLGSRLSALPLPPHLWWTRYVAALAYSICTPIGIAAGLGARSSYNGNGAAANIVSGVLDAISAGILLYTGLVELLAHEILLNPRMMKSKTSYLTYIFVCILVGSALMALLGRWA